MIPLRKMPRNTANSSFHFQNAAFKPLVTKRKINLKQLRYFANNWFSSWLQLRREANFSPAVGKSVFVVERQLALIGEIAISCLGNFNLFLFLYSCTICTLYIEQDVPKKSLSEFLDLALPLPVGCLNPAIVSNQLGFSKRPAI